MTKKDQYLAEQISIKAQFWVSTMLTLGIVLFPFIGIADYFVTPENFRKFFNYRLTITGIFIFFFFLNRLKRSKQYQYALIYLIIILSAITIEMMILSFGGHTSTYYAGLNLLIIAALGLIPFNTALAIITGLSIYAIYLVPILIFDTISDSRTFIANNVFMLATYAIGMTWRILSQRTMLSELSLQYDLEVQKKQLEVYSHDLKDVIAERTTELSESEQWHRSLFENATDGIIVLDRNGIIVNVNEKTCAMHGFTKEALVGAHIKLLEDGDKQAGMSELMRRILQGEALVFESVHNRKDGTPLYLEISSKAITIGGELFIQCFYRDISEKKKLQEHLFQSQKMESIGVLAGGIAHDFNNILTAILGHTDLIRRSACLDAKTTQSLNVVEDASRRAGRMISQLLGFARKSKYEMVPLNINDIVIETVKLLERVIAKDIELRVELASHVPLVQGDINQIEQVVMNLIVNARDAMPQGGSIVIKTTVAGVRQGMPNIPAYVLPGEYLVLGVADTGTGMPEDIKQKIFEPFFTTKERGKGTGLGLSMVYGAIKEHKGYIVVESKLGAGTVFTVYLPVSCSAALAKEKEPVFSVKGNESVIVVDDENEFLNAARETLASHGYQVLAFNDPVAALDLFRKTPNATALVITDIVMPHLGGKELIRQIKAIRPDCKILAVSGYAKYVAEKEEIQRIDGFLQKPFEAVDLLFTVRRILDARPQDALLV